jgi:polar amino acid transport system substrate-binding protein
MRNHSVSTMALRAGVVCGLLVLTACGGGGGGVTPEATSASEKPSVAKDDALAAMVPAELAADGMLTVGTDPTYAPNEFLAADGKTVQGFDVDLFDAVAAKLGLKTQYTAAPFANIIPSVQSGKYEIGVSSFTVNAERMQVVDMVSYFSAGTQWATKSGNPTGISADAACGKRVAVQKGTIQVDDITARSDKCTTSGQQAIAIDQFQGQDQATAAVVSGKDDAMLADSPIVAYAVKQTGGQLETLGDIYDSAPYGYAIKQGNGDLAQAIAEAVNALIDDGTYDKVLEPWGVQQGAISKAEVNPSVS